MFTSMLPSLTKNLQTVCTKIKCFIKVLKETTRSADNDISVGYPLCLLLKWLVKKKSFQFICKYQTKLKRERRVWLHNQTVTEKMVNWCTSSNL